jgi:hypothetical protein
MKQHMLPETARMFSLCVHRVVARADAPNADVIRWMNENIAKTESGFRPWIRMGQEFKFVHERDAVMFALRWS